MININKKSKKQKKLNSSICILELLLDHKESHHDHHDHCDHQFQL